MARVELEIPPRSAYVGVVRLAVSSLARTGGLDEESVDDLGIAVSEACANAVLARESGAEANSISVAWEDNDPRFEVEVRHDGNIYVSTAELGDGPEIASRVAMSVALLESLVDECKISTADDGATSVRLVLERPAEAATTGRKELSE